MDWTQTLTIIGVNAAVLAIFATLLVWVVSKLDADIKTVGNQVDGLSKRLDGHASRIDQLYQMFVDLLKEGRK